MKKKKASAAPSRKLLTRAAVPEGLVVVSRARLTRARSTVGRGGSMVARGRTAAASAAALLEQALTPVALPVDEATARQVAAFGLLGYPGLERLEIDLRRRVHWSGSVIPLRTSPVLELGLDLRRRGAEAVVHLNGSGQPTVLWFKPGFTECLSLAPPTMDASALVAGVVRDFGCADWLAQRATLLAPLPGPLAPAVAAGTMARLWTSTKARTRARRLLESADSPARRAREWFEALMPAQQRDVQGAAVDEASDLADGLAHLEELAAGDPALTRAVALDWLRRRDDLESVRFIMGAEARRAVVPALQGLDRAAAVALTVFADVDLPRDEQLRSAAWKEPNAWWAALTLR